MTKKRSQMNHFKKRTLQRTGMVIDKKIHDNIVEMIIKGKSEIYDKQSNRVSVHVVELNGEKHRVVYDKNRKQCITILPKEII